MKMFFIKQNRYDWKDIESFEQNIDLFLTIFATHIIIKLFFKDTYFCISTLGSNLETSKISKRRSKTGTEIFRMSLR